MVMTDLMFLFTKSADLKYQFGYLYITVYISGYIANIIHVVFTYLSHLKIAAKKASISRSTKTELKRNFVIQVAEAPEPPEPEISDSVAQPENSDPVSDPENSDSIAEPSLLQLPQDELENRLVELDQQIFPNDWIEEEEAPREE